MRRLLGTLTALVIIGSPLAVAIPAQATGYFDMVNNNSNSASYGCLIDDHAGAGHQLIMGIDSNDICTGGTDFLLTNENIINGVVTWEIADTIGCMNRSDNTGVYINQCIPGDSTEEWISTGNHYWKNVHAGTNGYLNVDCNPTLLCPETVVAVNPTNPWATPDS